jgi:hypothetical protein
MDLSDVRKPSLKPFTFKHMKELTPERNPMDVSNVGKHSLKLVNSKYKKQLTNK